MSAKRWVALVITIAVLAALGYGGYRAYRTIYQRLTPERCTVEVDETEVTLTQEQATNASVIVAASVARELPRRAAVVALITAYQESGLRNLDYGDRDSLGLFQQRPSQGWGTEEEIMDPWYSSNKFYEALEKVSGWEDLSLNDAAQKVQISGFPDAYGKHSDKATAIAKSLLGEPASMSCINFSPSDAEPDAFAAVLEAVGADFTVSVEAGSGGHVTVAGDEQEVWSAANLIMANGYAGGLTKAEVLGHVWTPDRAGWREAKADSDGATMTVGSPKD